MLRVFGPSLFSIPLSLLVLSSCIKRQDAQVRSLRSEERNGVVDRIYLAVRPIEKSFGAFKDAEVGPKIKGNAVEILACYGEPLDDTQLSKDGIKLKERVFVSDFSPLIENPEATYEEQEGRCEVIVGSAADALKIRNAPENNSAFDKDAEFNATFSTVAGCLASSGSAVKFGGETVKAAKGIGAAIQTGFLKSLKEVKNPGGKVGAGLLALTGAAGAVLCAHNFFNNFLATKKESAEQNARKIFFDHLAAIDKLAMRDFMLSDDEDIRVKAEQVEKLLNPGYGREPSAEQVFRARSIFSEFLVRKFNTDHTLYGYPDGRDRSEVDQNLDYTRDHDFRFKQEGQVAQAGMRQFTDALRTLQTETSDDGSVID